MIIHKSRPIVKSRASGGYRRGIAPVQIAQELARCGRNMRLTGQREGEVAAERRVELADGNAVRHTAQNQLRQQTDAQPALDHGHDGVIIPRRKAHVRRDTVLSRFAYRKTAQRRVRSFFLRPAGVRESTGAQAGQKNRRHTSVCRRFVHLALRNREPLIDGPAYHGVF